MKAATMYNILLRIARNLLETSENIKILTHPVYHTNLYENEAKKNFFEEKKNQNGRFFKMAVFQNSQFSKKNCAFFA